MGTGASEVKRCNHSHSKRPEAPSQPPGRLSDMRLFNLTPARVPAEPFCLASYPSAFHSVMFNPVEPRLIATANSKEGVGLWDIRKPRRWDPYPPLSAASSLSQPFSKQAASFISQSQSEPAEARFFWLAFCPPDGTVASVTLPLWSFVYFLQIWTHSKFCLTSSLLAPPASSIAVLLPGKSSHLVNF